MKFDSLPTIEAFAEIEMLEDVVSSCVLGNSRFAVGTIDGKLQIFELDDLLQDADFDSAIISIIESSEEVIAASITGEIKSLTDSLNWHHEIQSGIEHMAQLEDLICVSDTSGSIIFLNFKGDEVRTSLMEM